MDRKDVQKLEKYFRKTFQLASISVRPRPRKDETAEVFIGEEFIGVLFRDDEDGDVSYNFTMAILDIDLE